MDKMISLDKLCNMDYTIWISLTVVLHICCAAPILTTTLVPPVEDQTRQQHAASTSSKNQIRPAHTGLSWYLQHYSGLDDPRDIYPDVIEPKPLDTQPLDAYIQPSSDSTAQQPPQPQTAEPVDVYTARNTTREFHQDYYVDIEGLLTQIEEGNTYDSSENENEDDNNDRNDLEEDVNTDQGHWWSWFSFNNNNSAGEGDTEVITTETGGQQGEVTTDTQSDSIGGSRHSNSTSEAELQPTPYYRTETEDYRNEHRSEYDFSLDIQPGDYQTSAPYQLTTESLLDGTGLESVANPESREEGYHPNNYYPEISTAPDPGLVSNPEHSAVVVSTENSSVENSTAGDLELPPITTTDAWLAEQAQVVTGGISIVTQGSETGWTDGVDNSIDNNNRDNITTGGEGENEGGSSGEFPAEVTSKLPSDITESLSVNEEQTTTSLDLINNRNSNANNNRDVNILQASESVGTAQPSLGNGENNNKKGDSTDKAGDRQNSEDKRHGDSRDTSLEGTTVPEYWDKGIILGSTLTIAGVIILGIMITLCCACVRRDKGEAEDKKSSSGGNFDDGDNNSDDSYGFNSKQRKSRPSQGDSGGGLGTDSSREYSLERGGGTCGEEIGEAHEIQPQKSSNVFASAFNSLTWKRKDKKKNKKPQLGGNHGDVEAVSVKDRVKAFEGSAGANGSQDQDLKPKKKKPQSKAFAEFENTGLIIGFGNPRKSKTASTTDSQDSVPYNTEFPGFNIPEEASSEDPQSPQFFPGSSNERVNSEGESVGSTNEYRMQSKYQESNTSISLSSGSKLTEDEGIHTMDSEGEDDEFSNAVPRQTEILKSFRRAPPPRNRGKSRRPPQRKSPLRETSKFDTNAVREEDENEVEMSQTKEMSHQNMSQPKDIPSQKNKDTSQTNLFQYKDTTGSNVSNVSQDKDKLSDSRSNTVSNEKGPVQRLSKQYPDRFNLDVKRTPSPSDKPFTKTTGLPRETSDHNKSVVTNVSKPNWNIQSGNIARTAYVNPSQQSNVNPGYGNPSLRTNGNNTSQSLNMQNYNATRSQTSSVKPTTTAITNRNKEDTSTAKTSVVNPIPKDSNMNSYTKPFGKEDPPKANANHLAMFRNGHSLHDNTKQPGSYKSTLSWTLNATPETPSEKQEKQSQPKLTKLTVGPSWAKRNYDLTEEDKSDSSPPPPPVPPKLESTTKPRAKSQWWGGGTSAEAKFKRMPTPPGSKEVDTGSKENRVLYRYKEPGGDNNNGPGLVDSNRPKSMSGSQYIHKDAKEEQMNNNQPPQQGTFEAEATFSNQGGNYSFYTPNPLEQDSDEDKPRKPTNSQSKDSKGWSHDDLSHDNRGQAVQRDTSFEGAGKGVTKPISGLGQSSEVTYKPFYANSSSEKAYHRQTSMPAYPYSTPQNPHVTNTPGGMTPSQTFSQEHPHRSYSYNGPNYTPNQGYIPSRGYTPTQPQNANRPTTGNQGYSVNNNATGSRSEQHGTAHHSGSYAYSPSALSTEKPTFEATDNVFEENRLLPSNNHFLNNQVHVYNQPSSNVSSGHVLTSPSDNSYHSNLTSPMDTSYSGGSHSPISPLSNDSFHGNTSGNPSEMGYRSHRYSSSGSHDQSCDVGSMGVSSTKSRSSSLKFNMECEGTSV